MLGILGGMGTIATEQFIEDLIRCQSNAQTDQDFINYILFNYSEIPDRTDFILGKSQNSPIPYLIEGLKKLSLFNPDLIVVPCNTAHYYYNEMQASTSIPIINMVEEAAQEIKILRKHGRVLILATEGSIKCKVYEKALQEKGLNPIVPDQSLQTIVNAIIYEYIKKNKKLDQVINEAFVSALADYTYDIILLGCTELSTAYYQWPDIKETFVDPQLVVAKRIIERLKGL